MEIEMWLKFAVIAQIIGCVIFVVLYLNEPKLVEFEDKVIDRIKRSFRRLTKDL